MEKVTLETPVKAILGHKYQLMHCGAMVAKRDDFPDFWDKTSTHYTDSPTSTSNTESGGGAAATTDKILKEIFELNNTTWCAIDMTKEYIILYPAKNEAEAAAKWEAARIARNQKYITLYKKGRGYYDVDKETLEVKENNDDDMPHLINSDGEIVTDKDDELLVG